MRQLAKLMQISGRTVEDRCSAIQDNAAGSFKFNSMEINMKPAFIALFVAAAFESTVAIAQIETLPLQSPAERQVQQTNRAIQQELQQTQQENQQTLQNDQVQSEADRLRLQGQQHEISGPDIRRRW